MSGLARTGDGRARGNLRGRCGRGRWAWRWRFAHDEVAATAKANGRAGLAGVPANLPAPLAEIGAYEVMGSSSLRGDWGRR